ncbi:MAG: Gfo/Idh/MocA family oxidoreductase [Treponema sp.]|nr:Gfo/Idh/MocA family oxidoreductase [Treponema sp.]
MQRIGVVGIGNISKIYLDNLAGMFSKSVKLTAVTNPTFERAEKAAAEYNIKAFKTLDDMLKDGGVDIILNLTPPKAHYETALAAVKAGKHVYNEKPVCVKREEATHLIRTAAEMKVRVAGAPDTFLGDGIQTCRKLIDNGWIGRPLAASANFMNHGPESWHPSPHFFYKDGAGPLFDVGPYYLTALVYLLGHVERVCGSAKISAPQRTITNKYNYGEKINVEVPTHIYAVLDFSCGMSASLTASFDVYHHSMPFIEIYGTEGTLKVPDPNTFGGPVLLRRMNDDKWSEIPLIGNHSENSRGIGVADMAEAIEEGRPHHASAELVYHVLDIMHGIHEASVSGKYFKSASAKQLKRMCKRQ